MICKKPFIFTKRKMFACLTVVGVLLFFLIREFSFMIFGFLKVFKMKAIVF